MLCLSSTVLFDFGAGGRFRFWFVSIWFGVGFYLFHGVFPQCFGSLLTNYQYRCQTAVFSQNLIGFFFFFFTSLIVAISSQPMGKMDFSS